MIVFNHKINELSQVWSRLYPSESLPKSITFQVTDDCNLKCTYCYQCNKGHHSMPFEVAKKFIDDLLENSYKDDSYININNSNGVIIDFIGGEPLLEIELIDKIVDYFKLRCVELNHPWALQFMVSICTNGVLHKSEKVQKFINKHKNYLSYNITIDGNKKLHDSCRIKHDGSGSYDEAIAGVRDMTSKGFFLGSKMTLAPENLDYLLEAVIGYIEEGQDDINLNCVFENVWSIDHAKLLYRKLKELSDYSLENDLYDKVEMSIFEQGSFRPCSKSNNQNWCGGTGSMIALDYKGDIFPCLRYMESSLGDKVDPIIIGNLDRGIMASDNDKEVVDSLKLITRESQSTEQDFWSPIAQGEAWCSAYNYQCTGSVNHRVNYIHIMHVARALANVYYWNKAYIAEYVKGNTPDVFINHVPKSWALKIISEDEWNLLKDLENVNKKICDEANISYDKIYGYIYKIDGKLNSLVGDEFNIDNGYELVYECKDKDDMDEMLEYFAHNEWKGKQPDSKYRT